MLIGTIILMGVGLGTIIGVGAATNDDFWDL